MSLYRESSREAIVAHLAWQGIPATQERVDECRRLLPSCPPEDREEAGIEPMPCRCGHPNCGYCA